MSNNNSAIVKHRPEPPPGPLKTFDLFTIALGSAVGAGVIAFTGQALAYTGQSAWLAYAIAVFWGALFALPAFMISSLFRCAGGQYSVVTAVLGPKLGAICGLGGFGTMLTLGVYGTSFAVYLGSLFPGINPTFTAIALVVVFYFINLMGIKIASKVQNIMFVGLLIALLIFIIMGIANLQQPVFNFGNPDFMTNGFSGFMSAMILLSTSCSAYLYTFQYGISAKNATRDIPKAMLLCIPVMFVLYVGCAIVAGGILPLEEVAGQPLTYVAKVILPGPLFYFFMICGPLICITTSLNGLMPALTNVVATTIEDGWLPKWLAKRNKNGVPYILLSISALIGILPAALGFNPSEIIQNVNIFTNSLNLIFIAAVCYAPIKYKDVYEKSFIRKLPKPIFYLLLALSAGISLYNFVEMCVQVQLSVALISVALLVIVFVWCLIRGKSSELTVTVSMWEPHGDEDAVKAEE